VDVDGAMKSIRFPKVLRAARQLMPLRGRRVSGWIGDLDGVAVVPGKPNYLYVTLANKAVVEAYNPGMPPGDRIPVILEPDEMNPSRYTILGPRDMFNGDYDYPLMKAHRDAHTWGGYDAVPVELRQIMPLCPFVSGFTLTVRAGRAKTPTGWMYYPGGESFDLSAYKPTSGARFVLISISSSKVVTITSGSVVSGGIFYLSDDDIPALPAQHTPICAIRLFAGQTAIRDQVRNTDVIDLRFTSNAGDAGSATWGGILGTLADQADLQAALDGKQASDADLTAIAGLTPANDDIIQRKAGAWVNRTMAQLAADLQSLLSIAWGQITGAPSTFPPSSHTHTQSESHNSPDTDTSASALHHTIGTGANQAAAGNHVHPGVYEPANANIQSHIASTANPHGVTKSQVGLGNVDNTSDANKPVSTLQAAADALRVLANSAITGGTKTKITYDAKGLVTSGADATQDDIAAGATYGRLTNTQITDLTDAGDSSLHYHSADRNRANHTGTQLSSTISDFAATVLATFLTGLSTATNAVITSADSVLSALGKLQAQITGLSSVYAPIAKGVTNGDSHDHSGGDGAQINHTTLGNIGTNTHAQIDTHIAASNPHSGAAPLASPALTGIPTAPTAAVGTNTTQVATTAFVNAEINGDRPFSNADPLMDGTAAQGTAARVSRQDHVHPTDTSRAPLASPTFTGIPAAPTAAADTNTTQLATTAFAKKEADDAQAYAIQRANHTGTQLAATISNFNTAALAAAPAETVNTVGALINGSTATTTPANTDRFSLSISSVLRHVTWANIKATLKTYFDSLYPTLSATRYCYVFGSYNTLPPITSVTTYPFSCTLPSFTTYPKQYSQAIFLSAGASDASNYWTLTLYDYGTSTAIASVNTSALAAGSGHLLTDTTLALSSVTQATHRYLYVRVDRTGSPGNISVRAPAVEYTLS
jgi:hypothetical protein